MREVLRPRAREEFLPRVEFENGAHDRVRGRETTRSGCARQQPVHRLERATVQRMLSGPPDSGPTSPGPHQGSTSGEPGGLGTPFLSPKDLMRRRLSESADRCLPPRYGLPG